MDAWILLLCLIVGLSSSRRGPNRNLCLPLLLLLLWNGLMMIWLLLLLLHEWLRETREPLLLNRQ